MPTMLQVYVNDLHERRTGSHVDAENLRQLLTGLRQEEETRDR